MRIYNIRYNPVLNHLGKIARSIVLPNFRAIEYKIFEFQKYVVDIVLKSSFKIMVTIIVAFMFHKAKIYNITMFYNSFSNLV